MENELKYPIKYAPMLIEYINGYDKTNKPIKMKYCYIAVPCYLLKEMKSYNMDGTVDSSYGVVYFKNRQELSFGKNMDQVPKIKDGKILNLTKVDIVSNDFERVKEYCDEKNIGCFSVNFCNKEIEELKKLSKEYYDNIDRYYDIIKINELRNQVEKRKNKTYSK